MATAPSAPNAPIDAALSPALAAAAVPSIGAAPQGTVTFWPCLTSTDGELGLVGLETVTVPSKTDTGLNSLQLGNLSFCTQVW
jgi:hypothetical protein